MSRNLVERVGLFGGTFAPPHLGHIYAAEKALDMLGLDRLIIMPAYIPPHKIENGLDTPELRYEMCRAAFSSLPRCEVSDYEIKKGGVSYTVETIEHLKTDGNEIYLLCGGDMFLTLGKWYRADRIFSLARIAAVPRKSDDMGKMNEQKRLYEEKYSAGICFIDVNPHELSSTEVREAAMRGEKLEKYLGDGVIKLIKKYNLYSGENERKNYVI